MSRAATVWDVPVRVGHFAMMSLCAAQYATARFDVGTMDQHRIIGETLLALLLFRVLWGVFGSDSARFAGFLVGPSRVLAYLRRPATFDGRSHNPLGGWAVIVLLFMLLALAISGLFASDDIDIAGPLAAWVGDDTIRAATRWHHRLADALPWLLGLHVLAVLVHEARGERLIAAMWHGRRDTTGAPPRLASTARAAWLAAISAILVAALIRAAA